MNSIREGPFVEKPATNRQGVPLWSPLGAMLAIAVITFVIWITGTLEWLSSKMF